MKLWPFRRRARLAALQRDRDAAEAFLKAAEARRDTRDIHRARERLRQATTALLRAEVS